MRDSLSEITKLYLGESDEYDQRRLRSAQMGIRARGETLKVLRGMCCLADYLQLHFEDSATPAQLMRYSMSPRALFKTLAQLGYKWNDKSRIWRLFASLKKPRQIRKGTNQ